MQVKSVESVLASARWAVYCYRHHQTYLNDTSAAEQYHQAMNEYRTAYFLMYPSAVALPDPSLYIAEQKRSPATAAPHAPQSDAYDRLRQERDERENKADAPFTQAILDNLANRPSVTEAELKAQRESYARNYSPGPRQARPFRSTKCPYCVGLGKRYAADTDSTELCPGCCGSGIDQVVFATDATVTGRLSSAKPNLSNEPKSKDRTDFTKEPWISMDFGKQEGTWRGMPGSIFQFDEVADSFLLGPDKQPSKDVNPLVYGLGCAMALAIGIWIGRKVPWRK